MAVNHELAAKYKGMQLRDTTELNQATKVPKNGKFRPHHL